MRRLTVRQSAVLAALERRGEPTTVIELHAEFPHLQASEVLRVLEALERRGLVEASGNRAWVYASGFDDVALGIGDAEVVRFRLVQRD